MARPRYSSLVSTIPSNAPRCKTLLDMICQVPESLGRLTGLRSLRLDENSSLQGPIPEPLASRSGCDVRADELVLEDTEATMLGSRLDEWFLMPRKASEHERNTLNRFMKDYHNILFESPGGRP